MAHNPLHVTVIGPPLAASGGIGRVMSYAFTVLRPEDIDLRVLDTRGLGPNPWSSLQPLLRTCGTLILLAADWRIDVAHVNISSGGSAFRKGLVVRVCRLLRIPVVLHLHASSFPAFYNPLPSLARRWVRQTFTLATRVIVLSELWRTYVVDELAVHPAQVTVLPNATPEMAPAAPEGCIDESLHFLFLGRLGKRKGVSELLNSLADPRVRDRPWRATLAGDGDNQMYRAYAAKLGLDERIDFPGWVCADEVADLLAQADVLVLPSHAEGLPMSVLEAFSAGLPVICTPVGGLPEIVVDGHNGLLVPVGDVKALADSLLKLLDDQLLRERLGTAARSTWQSNHSIERFARRLVAEWQSAVIGNGGSVGQRSQDAPLEE